MSATTTEAIRPPATPAQIRAAREEFQEPMAHSGDCSIEIDDDALSSHPDLDEGEEFYGCWVQAWVWVHAEEIEAAQEQIDKEAANGD